MGASLAVWRESPAGVDFYTVSHNINRVKEFFAKWYKKRKAATSAKPKPRAEAPRSAARLRARYRARQGARSVPKGRFRRDLARRSQRRHRHEPAEPLRRVRRQARALHQELSALSRRRARGDDRIFGRAADPRTAGSASMRWRSTFICPASGPRGCFTVMTAASEAVADPEIRAMVLEGFRELDKAFAACFRLARETVRLPATADPLVLAQLASATIHTVAIRARARRAAQGTGSDREGRDRHACWPADRP